MIGNSTNRDPKLLSIARLAGRWDVSPDTIRRLASTGAIRTVTIAARRLIPMDEVERAELSGVGKPRRKL